MVTLTFLIWCEKSGTTEAMQRRANDLHTTTLPETGNQLTDMQRYVFRLTSPSVLIARPVVSKNLYTHKRSFCVSSFLPGLLLPVLEEMRLSWNMVNTLKAPSKQRNFTAGSRRICTFCFLSFS
ncbi:hypothetical protein V6N12_016776 [Hibiscus sabdariffa]|uniref:Uncharacterized protein n=1 Tax=Hibiscus sabdariffa TaxID=183260 RepID=A0ABR2CEL5_9ROSI